MKSNHLSSEKKYGSKYSFFFIRAIHEWRFLDATTRRQEQRSGVMEYSKAQNNNLKIVFFSLLP